MKNFWKILALVLIGGMLFETGYFIITTNRLNNELTGSRAVADERQRIVDGGLDRIESIEDGLAGIRKGQRTIGIGLSDLQDELNGFDKEFADYISRAGEFNSVNYERYERLQDILRELAERANDDGETN